MQVGILSLIQNMIELGLVPLNLEEKQGVKYQNPPFYVVIGIGLYYLNPRGRLTLFAILVKSAVEWFHCNVIIFDCLHFEFGSVVDVLM